MNILINNVGKQFNGVTILKDINANFKEGNIYGLIGRNGSGKSVFLKMICAFYDVSFGEILFDNVNILKNNKFPPNTRALIEKPNFIPDLTGYDNLKLLANIQNIINNEKILQSLEVVNLLDDKDKKYKKYSLGMKQKLGIAQVIMEEPKVMIFDEPFNGVEKNTADKLRKYLKEEKEKGKLIIIASHIKEDIEELCDEVYVFENETMTLLKK